MHADQVGLVREPALLADETLGPQSVEDGVPGMILLPKGTKVTVTGNSRTKPALVGMAGTVKKAIGLGGWHWLVLESGEEVKLQRNALSVIAVPATVDPDTSEDENKTLLLQNQQAVGHAANGNGTGSCRTRARRVHLSPYVTPVPDNGAMQQAMARLISNHYGKPATRVNFLKLDLAALRKYQEFHKLAVSKEGQTKEELAELVGQHFVSQQVDEQDVVGSFFQAAKRVRTSLL